MKITKTQLQQIIKESIQEELGFTEDGPVPGGEGEVKKLNLDTIRSKLRTGEMKEMDIEDYRKYKPRVEEAGFALTDGNISTQKDNGVVAVGIYDGKAYFRVSGSYRDYLILPLEQ